MSDKMARRFRSLREEHHLSQREMATFLGVKEGLYKPYEEAGKPLIDPRFIKHAAEVLGVAPDYLLGWTDERLDSTKFTDEQWELIKKSQAGEHKDVKYLPRKRKRKE